MSGTGDDDKTSFASTEEKCKDRTPKQKTVRGTVKHGQKGEHAKDNVNPDPHKKSEDPGLPSTTHGDLSAASALPLSKSKAVHINLKPKIKQYASSAPGRFLCSPILGSERYEWKSHLFHEPKKSAMKPKTDQIWYGHHSEQAFSCSCNLFTSVHQCQLYHNIDVVCY